MEIAENSLGQLLDKTTDSSKIDKFTDDEPIEKADDACSTRSSCSTRSTPESKSGPTPPPSGISSKSIPKNLSQQQQQNPSVSIEKMFETFHQASNGEFKPTFYNPFEVRHRRRTSRSQFKILEKAFMNDCKPNSQTRKQLAEELNMSVRSIQVWFQNRRAKLKTMLKNGKMTDAQMIEYLKNQKQEDATSSQDSPSSFEDSDASDSETGGASEAPVEKQSSCFNPQKRAFPQANKDNEPPAVVCNPDTMPYGNSYPNQVRNRSYSLPAIQRSPQLPFKQLQEALFGQSQPAPPQQAPVPAPGPSALNAFQHYLRASNAVMSQVNCNNVSLLDIHAASYYPAPQGIAIPQLSNFTPLNEYTQQQVDPNRFRPRSSSFAVSNNRASSNSHSNNSSFSNDILSMIKEDSPISEYMNLPTSFGGHGNHGYYDGNESELLSNQINSLDLDYFMAANGSSAYQYGHAISHDCSSIHSSSIPESPITSSSTNNDNLNVHNYMNELDFLPQPTNEILLSTLIGDEHFLQ